MIRDPEAAALTLSRFRDLGVRVYLDDFGTGYSSLSLLRQLPINAIKIDRSFVREIDASHGASDLLAGILGLASALRLEVIAEGVETREQLDFLAARGCAAYQGYLVSPALVPESFEAWWRGAALPASSRGDNVPVTTARRHSS